MMEDETVRTGRPVTVWLLMLSTALLGVTAVFGGGMLVLDPSGDSMEMPVSWLEGTPFNDYLIPGLILLTVLGLYSFVVLYLIYTRDEGSWIAATALGLALITWISVQVLLINYDQINILQMIYFALGVGILGTSLLPSVRKYSEGTLTSPDRISEG